MADQVDGITQMGTFVMNFSKIIDTSRFSGRIPPNMSYPFALPRSRRPKPLLPEKAGSFLFG
jgi:hypothetical protein